MRVRVVWRVEKGVATADLRTLLSDIRVTNGVHRLRSMGDAQCCGIGGARQDTYTYTGNASTERRAAARRRPGAVRCSAVPYPALAWFG